MLEQKLLKQITKIKILKEERKVKKKDNKVIMKNNNNKKNLSCSILTILHWPWLFYLENWSLKSFGFQNILYTCIEN